MVTLEATKKAKRMQVFNLPHDTTETTVLVSEHNPRSGAVGLMRKVLRTPKSIRLLAGGRLEGLDDAVADAPGVNTAVRLDLVKVSKSTPAKPPKRTKGAEK